MPGLVLCRWLETGAAKGRGTTDSNTCAVLSKWTYTLSIIIPNTVPFLHCLCWCSSELFLSKCFCQSMITYTRLLLSAWNNLTPWIWSRIEMAFWCHVETCCFRALYLNPLRGWRSSFTVPKNRPCKMQLHEFLKLCVRLLDWIAPR